MIIYEGKYSWSGKKKSLTRPISWWAGAYWIKIIDFSKSLKKDVLMLRPIVIIVSDTGEGASATSCAPELVKNVCRDFNLDMLKVLWVEYHQDNELYMEVAKFTAVTTIQGEILYSASWRPIRLKELEMIAPFSQEAQKILDNLRLSG